MSEDQQLGFGDGDDDDMPPEMKAHMLAAFAHHAGLGPHPGMYKGPPRKKRDRDEPTDTDMQRAQEEPLDEQGESSAKKMRTAQMGLAPSPMEQAQVKQQGALEQQATTQGAVQAQQAQGAQVPIKAPSAPAGPVGAITPYPAQAGAVGPQQSEEPPPEPPGAPGGQEGP